MGDIEEEYLEGIEKEEELFLEGLKDNKSLAELEEKYSKKVKEIRKIYEKSLKKELYYQKEAKEHKKRENSEEKFKEFKAEGIELEKNKLQKTKILLESTHYKIKRKIRGFFDKIIPGKIIYFLHKIKINLIVIRKTTKSIFNFSINKISNSLNTIWVYVKEGFMKVVSEFKKFFSLFKKKKKQDKKDEGNKKEETKNEDGKKE